MKKIILTLCVIIVGSTVFAQTAFKEPKTQEELAELVESMMKSIRAVKTAKFTFVKNERYEVNG